jgi:hypothetical protein
MARGQRSQQVFRHEVRKEGRVVAVLRGVAGTDGGLTVETEVFPVTATANAEAQVRPFAFATDQQARRFVDEALLAFEYLGCTLAE